MQRALLNTVAPVVAAIVMATSPVEAQTPEQQGKAVAEEADRQDFGWHDNASIMRMLLRNRSGQESVRELRRRVLESTERERGDKSVIIFESPRDIQGTALLSHTRSWSPTINGCTSRRSSA